MPAKPPPTTITWFAGNTAAIAISSSKHRVTPPREFPFLSLDESEAPTWTGKTQNAPRAGMDRCDFRTTSLSKATANLLLYPQVVLLGMLRKNKMQSGSMDAVQVWQMNRYSLLNAPVTPSQAHRLPAHHQCQYPSRPGYS
eukprot:2317092-Amphidinium_carterae.1